MDTPIGEGAEDARPERSRYRMPLDDRHEKLEALWREIAADDTPLKPWPENDPVVEKYRRKGLIE